MKIRRAKKEDARKISLLKRKTLREVNSRDYPLSFLNHLIGKNNFNSVLRKIKERDLFCLVEGSKILGVIDLNENKIGGLFVRSECIGKGYGKELLFFIEDYSRKKGLKKLILYPTKSAESFYLKFGYKKSGKISRWVIGEERLNVPLMEKVLK